MHVCLCNMRICCEFSRAKLYGINVCLYISGARDEEHVQALG